MYKLESHFCPVCEDELRTEADIAAHKFTCGDDYWDDVFDQIFGNQHRTKTRVDMAGEDE